MLLAKVTGCAVSTEKDPRLTGLRFLLVRPDGADSAPLLAAADQLGAGKGDTVLIATGAAARLALDRPDAPVDAAVVAIVDHCVL